MHQSAGDHEATHHGLGHVVPAPVLLAVWGGLVILTIITVKVPDYVDIGRWNIALALAIATVKAAFVCLYFMHLRYDSPFNAFAMIVALSFVALFIVGTITDTAAYQPAMQWPQGIPGGPG
jgi:cytochrome c oxidase subunit 4